MPSFQDSAVIFFIALLLFGPKKLPELARYVGKLMNEFRRASSEFRMQMDDEFRQIEQAEQQKKIAAMEAAAPVAPTIEPSIGSPITPHVEFDPDQPYIPPTAPEDIAAQADRQNTSDASTTIEPENSDSGAPSQSASSIEVGSHPLPIASSGDLHLMPPETGLPIGRSNSLGGVFDSIPKTTDTAAIHQDPDTHSETHTHG